MKKEKHSHRHNDDERKEDMMMCCAIVFVCAIMALGIFTIGKKVHKEYSEIVMEKEYLTYVREFVTDSGTTLEKEAYNNRVEVYNEKISDVPGIFFSLEKIEKVELESETA